MKRCRLPDGASIHTVVEEHDQGASPVPTNGIRVPPTSRALHLVSCEVERVDLRLGQVVPARNVALWIVFRESRQDIDNVLLPRPRHHGAQMRTNLVRGPPWISSLLCGSVLIDPIQKLTDCFACNFVKRKPSAPACPLSERCGILFARSLRWISRTKVLCNYCFESRRHC